MKKILIAAALIGTVSTSSALAKTEGNYLGIDALRSSAQVKSHSDSAADAADATLSSFYTHKKRETGYGVGVNYKYAFNFNNFFVAPGVSYDLINNKIKSDYASSSTDYYTQTVSLKNLFSLRANLGYDVNDGFAVYVPVGISSVSYEIKTADVIGSSSATSKKTGRDSALFFGLGFSYQPVKNWVVSLEYNKFQDLKLTSNTATFSGGKIKATVSSDLARLGLAYKF